MKDSRGENMTVPMMIQSGTISLVFGHIPYQTAQDVNNNCFKVAEKKLPDNILMLGRKDLFALLQPERIRPGQKYR
jgi:hypothetical protein